MSRRRPPRSTVRRLAVAGLVTVLGGGAALVPASAHAARTPEIPAIKAVAKTYPHVAGGERLITGSDVEIFGRTCAADPVPVPRAAGIQADYFGKDYVEPTRRTPQVSLRAIRFPSAKKAKLFAARYHRWARTCLRAEGETRNVRFEVDLGDAGWGRSIRLRPGGGDAFDANVILVRERTLVVTTITGSQSGRLPRPAKAVRLADLTLRTAR